MEKWKLEVSDKETFLTILIIPIAVQWWAVWYQKM